MEDKKKNKIRGGGGKCIVYLVVILHIIKHFSSQFFLHAYISLSIRMTTALI